MNVEVSEEPISALADYASIPIAFEVSTFLDVKDGRNGEFVLTERKLAAPYIKDYDAVSGETPNQWAQHFDLSNWGLFVARVEGGSVGAAAVAFKTPTITMLEGREDLGILWDIRVRSEARGQGVGSALFRIAEAWAKARGCAQLKIETQNINVPACKFYSSQGCVLAAVHRGVYQEFPDELQMLWYKDLSRQVIVK